MLDSTTHSMPHRFTPLSMERLVEWISDELVAQDAILSIPRELFFRPRPDGPLACIWRECRLDTPVGVAAGPHSQLAANIVAAWLCGARVIELKTVQTLDEITVVKPCIDMEDAGYNIEWSQELTLDQSFDEYLRAWVLVHALHHRLGFAGSSTGVLFDVSVGYDLKGVRQPNMQRFLERCVDAGRDLDRAVAAAATRIPEAAAEIPRGFAGGITLSTMHGCRPEEIALIAGYLMERWRLPTTIKLNPTLLGAEEVAHILHDELGFEDVTLSAEAFAGDPTFEEAVELIRELTAVGERRGVTFGLKLANTLPVVNHRDVFDLEQSRMYMSGRPLHAVTVRLASRLQEEFDGRLRISFAGGADAFNAPALLAAGLRPITACSDLLRPGGYLRLGQYLDNISAAMEMVGADRLDDLVLRTAGDWDPSDGNFLERTARAAQQNLTSYSDAVLQDPALQGARFDRSRAKGRRALGHFDCIAAPCTEACDVGQRVPEYMRLLASGDLAGAAAVIRDDNPLPATLGRACHHPCELPCLRTHLDDPIAIREIKRFVTDTAAAPPRDLPAPTGNPRAAVIGAGPCGLAAAEFLARAGIAVTVFEARSASGGMVSGSIPGFRAGRDAVDRDLSWIAAAGIEVRHGQKVGRDVTLEAMRAAGFRYIVAAAGAQKGARLGVPGDDSSGVWDGLVFLRAARSGQLTELPGRVGVIGGGDVAIDCARTARRLGASEVTVIYRRSRREMPAQREEVEALAEEGIPVLEQTLPLAVVADSGRVCGLRCAATMLGEPDDSGRRRPIRMWGSDREIPLDALVVAVGQRADLALFGAERPEVNRAGFLVVDPATLETSLPNVFAGGDLIGDGPATIVKACGDGRRIAAAIAAREGRAAHAAAAEAHFIDRTDLLRRRSQRQFRERVSQLPPGQRAGFDEVIATYPPAKAVAEAGRCLDCDLLCSTCETVCPNRAIFTYRSAARVLELPVLRWHRGKPAVAGQERVEVRQPYQVAVIADLCNDCGNCTTFCPTSGRPFADKPRLFLDEASFQAQTDNAFRLLRHAGGWTVQAALDGARHELEIAEPLRYRTGGVELRLASDTLEVLGTRLTGEAPADPISLRRCATMLALFHGIRGSVPWIPTAAAESPG
ncbi:MAG: putative selenate reductase subunit YgfK [Holophagae bacterium]|nr:MAG: putative selenate reductase subunit YgfK [Holophagae bacterium]